MKLKQSGKEVKMGEKLIKTVDLFGFPIPIEVIEVNKSTLVDLIKSGIIVEVEEYPDYTSDFTIEDVVKHLANRIGWDIKNLERYFNNLYKISPAAVFEIVLKEVAILLDERYPDHISNSKEIWIINKVNGRIQKLKDLSKIKSFKHFAAFRSLEDAITAKKVMAPALEDLYGKQEN